MNRYLTAAALGLAAISISSRTAAQTPNDSLSLSQATSLALRTLPQTIRAQGDLTVAESGRRAGVGAYLPNLSLSAGSSLTPQSGLGVSGIEPQGLRDSYDAGVSASYDVFTGGRRGAELKQANARVTSAEAALLNQRFAAILTTQQAYFDVLRTADLIEVSRARVERAGEALETATQRQRLGSATQSDVLRSRIELNSALEAQLTAESQHADAASSLGRLTGHDGPVWARIEGPLTQAALSLTNAQIVDIAVTTAPEVVSARAAALVAAAGTDAAHAQYLPSVSLSAGYGWQNQALSLAAGQTNWSVGVSVGYTLFNGFAREESVQRARTQSVTAEAERADAERVARADAEGALRAITLASERIALADEAAEAASEDLRVHTERYRLGVSTILEVLTSQTSLVEAQTNLIGARYDYQIARARLEAQLGRAL